MTYRELLQLYKQGKLDMEKKKQVEAEIEKQDAISEFLYEEGDIPDFSDLENGEDCFNNLDDKNQKAEWQDSKIDGNIEKRQGNLKSKREDDFNEGNPALYPQGFYQNGNNCRGCCFDICALRSLYPSESSLKILLRSKRSSRSV